MKGELLTIGEVSKMKGVGIKSLRYYEKIGVLKPAYVDENSGYRYYAMRQMADIDIIITCIDLGIPLKSLRGHMDENGAMDLGTMLDWGRRMAVENLRKAEITLAQLDNYQEETRAQAELSLKQDPYERRLPDRILLCEPWTAKRFDLKRYITSTTALYDQAKQSGLIPLYSQGLLLKREKRKPLWHTFVAVSIPSWSDSRKVAETLEQTGGGALAELPGGMFRGWRAKSESLAECFEDVFERCGQAEGPIVASEIWDAGVDGSEYVIEVLAKTRCGK